MQQAHRDIDAVYSMGLFDDVKILPQSAEDSTLETPILDLTLQVKERKNGGFSGGVGISAQVSLSPFAFPFPLLSLCFPSVFPLLSLCFPFPSAFPLFSLCFRFALPSLQLCLAPDSLCLLFAVPPSLCLLFKPCVLSFAFSFVHLSLLPPLQRHTVGSKLPALLLACQGKPFLVSLSRPSTAYILFTPAESMVDAQGNHRLYDQHHSAAMQLDAC